MDKQRPVNKVAHNDAYSASLMEMYTNWMDGDCFPEVRAANDR